MSDKGLGWLLLLGSVVGIGVYGYLLFLSPWCWLTIQVTAFCAVGVVLLIIAWIGYTLATTPPPLPFEDLDLSDSDAE